MTDKRTELPDVVEIHINTLQGVILQRIGPPPCAFRYEPGDYVGFVTEVRELKGVMCRDRDEGIALARNLEFYIRCRADELYRQGDAGTMHIAMVQATYDLLRRCKKGEKS